MKRNDLFAMCLQNLRRRKARTLLTVLGVVVGCCSIIIMVSIGVGMKESQDKMLSELGDLTIINVSPSFDSQKNKLNDDAIKQIMMIPGVEIATPKVTLQNISISVTAGNNERYQMSYAEIVGMDPEAIQKLGYKLEDGDYPSIKPYSVLIGKYFEYAFYDTKRPGSNNMVYPYSMDGTEDGDIPDPFFNANKTKVEIKLGDSDPTAETKQVTKKLEISGRMKEDYGKGYETSQGLVMNLKDLLKLQEEYQRANGIKVTKNQEYTTVLVKCNSIQDVESAEEQIRALGYNTNSMESIRKPMEDEARQKQMMLGGLGAISLLVAAIGITNTMIMSISERTREIGIMKALGCYVNDIRSMFLMESACIGFMGGVAGILISVLASVGMNLISGKAMITSFADIVTVLFTKGNRMSVIPPYLLIFALVFSILIGLISGYYPANKAVKISALEAIKSE